MDILDRLLGHDAWTTGQLLDRCRDLSDAQLDQEIDIGPRTLRKTLVHMIWNMEAWTDVISERPVRPKPPATRDYQSVEGLIARLQVIAPEMSRASRRLVAAGRLDTSWENPLTDPPSTNTLGSVIVHAITHNMHHRAHVLIMLRRLGVRGLIEGDVLSWESQKP
jgi:uncharacterized damage-inducible protein DinB